jgi:hypothetical protein
VPGATTPFTPANFGDSVDSRMLSLKFYGLNISNK